LSNELQGANTFRKKQMHKIYSELELNDKMIQYEKLIHLLLQNFDFTTQKQESYTGQDCK
jgi:hypothetical protein